VAALHANLKRLGYGLDAEETNAERFGDATQKAVMALQREAGLVTQIN
jgi:peptidoglycan hydrolase-like protein with peptidoglycan-binding domain